MKPLNFDNSPCSPTSSNCVIWGGPDLPCINLCKGDSITDVIEKIALELCEILDTLKITAYDLSCFNLANCSPQNFTDLINFLIVKVCELDNGTSSGGGGTTPSGGCPTDCFVEVAPCFVVGTTTTMNLTNYVTAIGTKLCGLVNTVALQQTAITGLTTRVELLEETPPPVYTLPTMTMFATLPSVPQLLINSVQPINVVIESFVNDIWFAFVAATGDAGCLSGAVTSQTVLPTDFSKVNPTAQMSVQYAGLWTAPAVTVCDTIKNIWACIKDLRNAPTVRTVTGLNTDNTDPFNPVVKISVDGTTVTGLGTPASPLVAVSSGGSSNNQKFITYPGDFTGTNYTITNADNGYSIIIINAATAVSITVPAGLTPKLQVGFIQDGSGTVTFLSAGTTLNTATTGANKIKGQYDQAYLEQGLTPAIYYLLGNVKV